MLALSFANDDSSFSVIGSNVQHVADFGSSTPMAFARYFAQNNSNIGYIMGVSNMNDTAPIFTIGELSGTELNPTSAVYISLLNGNVGIGGILEPTETLQVAGNTTIEGQLTMSTTSMPFIIDNSILITNLNADLLDGQDGSFYRNVTNMNVGTLSVLRGGTGRNSVPDGQILVGNGSSALAASSNLTYDSANSEFIVKGTVSLGPKTPTSGPFMRQKDWDAASTSHVLLFEDYALGENSAGTLSVQVSNKNNKIANIQCSFLKPQGNDVSLSIISQHRTTTLITCSLASSSSSNINVSTDSDCSIAWTVVGAL